MQSYSVMILLMETDPLDSPSRQEDNLIRGLYHASKLNSEFEFAGMSGPMLSIHAVQAMQERGMPEAADFKVAEARCAFDNFYATGSHQTLSYAIAIAHDFLGYEDLSKAWYAREDIEELIRQDTTCAIAEVSQASVAARYQDDDEFEMVLQMNRLGFEDTEGPISLFARLRFESALWHMVPVGTKKTPELISLLSIDELRAFGNRPNIRMAYDAVVSMTRRISAVCESEEMQSLSSDLVEGIAAAAMDIAMTDQRSESRLFAADLLPELLENDPENKKYQKWHRKLRRHFKLAELTTLPGISFHGYTSSQIQEALHSLGELTTADVMGVVAEYAVHSSVDEKD